MVSNGKNVGDKGAVPAPAWICGREGEKLDTFRHFKVLYGYFVWEMGGNIFEVVPMHTGCTMPSVISVLTTFPIFYAICMRNHRILTGNVVE